MPFPPLNPPRPRLPTSGRSRRLTVVLLLVACGDRSPSTPSTAETPVTPAPATLPAPAAVQIRVAGIPGSSNKQMLCKGPACSGEFTPPTSAQMPVKITGPAGTKVEIAGKEIGVAETGTSATIDLVRASFAMRATELEGKFYDPPQIAVTLRVTAPDKTVSKTTLTFEPLWALRDYLTLIEKGPLPFAVEGAAKFTNDSLVSLNDASLSHHGDVRARLWDVDFIAIEKESKRDSGVCHFVDEKGTKVDKFRTVTDLAVKVYDRRTGKQVGARTFRSKTGGCPASMLETSELDYRYDLAAPTAFLDGFVKERGVADDEIPLPVETVATPMFAAVRPPLPALEDMKQRFWKLGFKQVGDEAEFKDLFGMHTFHLLGTKEGKKNNRVLKVVSIANIANSQDKPIAAIRPRSFLLVLVTSGKDIYASRDLFDKLVDKTDAAQLVAALRADGWTCSDDPVVDPAGMNEESLSATRGGELANVIFHEWGALVDGKSRYADAVHVGQNGFVYTGGDSQAESDEIMKVVLGR